MIKNLKNNNFTLVLSGGGALGIAHLGIIHDLEKQNITPSEIVGTSMGAIIGACVAIKMKEREIFKLIEKFSNIFKLVKLSLSGNSIIKSTKIESALSAIFSDTKMKDAKIPLKIIATNLLSGEIKVFNRDDDVKIKDAILASIAIPGIFEEKSINNTIYSDGFLCENLGVLQATYDNILAVDVLGKNSFETDMPSNFLKTKNILEMFEKSIRILICNQTKTILKNSTKNTHLIEPNTKKYKTFQFYKYKKIRELGLNLLNPIYCQ